MSLLNSGHHLSESLSFMYNKHAEYVPQKKQKCQGFKPIILCILIVEFCERLTFYSINANFVRYCTIYLEISNIEAVNFSLVFTGCIYIISIFCGWISDAILGKFQTIILSCIIYCMGVALLCFVAFDIEKYFSLAFALTTVDRRVFSGFGLVMIAIATSGIKTTVGPFGAEQFENKNEDVIRSFFIWLYWFVNMGSAIAFIFITYIQQNVDFFTGLLIPLCSIVVALIIFLFPMKFYNKSHTMARNSFFTPINVVCESLRKRASTIYKYKNLLDYARLSKGGNFEEHTIEDLIIIKRLIPVMLTFIPFYISYVQMQSTYLLQAERLDLKISNFLIPVASLNVVNSAVIIFVIPFLAILIYPIWKKWFKKPASPLQRIGFGLFLSGLSVIMAGVLEIFRKKDLREYGGIPQEVFGINYNVSSISVLMQIPQFFFVGAGEVFASATGLEFAYSQAPVSQQSLITGIFYVMVGIGSFSSILLIFLVNLNKNNQWMPSNIDEGHYEYFFFLLGGIIFLDVIIFIFIARSYKYADHNLKNNFTVKFHSKDQTEEVLIYQ